MEIKVSLEVYKALTAMLRHEGDTYSDLIRDIMALDSPLEDEPVRPLSAVLDALQAVSHLPPSGFEGFSSRGLHLPNGTKLRARYKGDLYHGEIIASRWTAPDNAEFDSPSAAASAITKNNVNGLRFWEALLPNEEVWRRLDSLRP